MPVCLEPVPANGKGWLGMVLFGNGHCMAAVLQEDVSLYSVLMEVVSTCDPHNSCNVFAAYLSDGFGSSQALPSPFPCPRDSWLFRFIYDWTALLALQAVYMRIPLLLHAQISGLFFIRSCRYNDSCMYDNPF